MPRFPELLSPAGTLKNMRYAFAYGADAVYAGQPRYSLRVRNNEFDHANLALGIDEAHAQGKQFYVVVNIAPHNAKLKTFLKDLAPVIEMAPDALIMSDPGLIMLVRQHFPQMPIHLSVQANAVNWASVEFWRQQGLTRVILSRELSLEEIEEIRRQVPGMELEVFVHGALCMAYSGRCLLSGYINRRDPNQGTCTNACRWQYQATPAAENELGEIVRMVEPTLGQGTPTSQAFVLQEAGRPDEEMTAFEDEHGTYIMNSKDLRAVQHVGRLVRMGVHSLKIEGRTKSHFYCARTAQAYRRAIDDAVARRPFDPGLMPGTGLARERSAVERWAWSNVLPLLAHVMPGTSTARRSALALAKLLTGRAFPGGSGLHVDFTLAETPSSRDSRREDWQEELLRFADCAALEP